MSLAKTLEIRTSPHILSGYSVDVIMWNVVLALVPVTVFAVFAFGLAALSTLAAALAACVVTEHLACRLGGRPSTVGDGSAAITGLLYGLTLPPALPLWMTAAGGVAAVAVGKSLFGGLGYNPFNPALVGRAVLQAAFPAAMTTWIPAFAAGRFAQWPSSTWTPPFTQPVYDGLTGATPLSMWKFDHVATAASDLAMGVTSGSTGETSALLILLGGVYLVARNMMSWRIPAAILGTVAALSGLLHLLDAERYASPVFMLFAGGLMLGAVFMATDMVASPMTRLGCTLYGVFIGAVVVVIRVWGGMPEGVMYAVLLGNAVSPHIDRWIRPTVYGTAGRGREAAS
jgi:H+/Na+-translocating ferredoxin:NAD+ oxidoreductase subunit D